jgi:hypothetical protein
MLLSHASGSYSISQHSPAITDATHQHTMQYDPLKLLQTLITITFNTAYAQEFHYKCIHILIRMLQYAGYSYEWNAGWFYMLHDP